MKQIAVYLMLVLGGKANPTKDDVMKAMSSVGLEADEQRLENFVADMEGKDLGELFELGTSRLAKINTGGGGGGGGGGAAAGVGEEEKEEEKEDEEEEADLGGGMEIFGGGDDGDY